MLAEASVTVVVSVPVVVVSVAVPELSVTVGSVVEAVDIWIYFL